MIRIDGMRLTFDWPEGTGINENWSELLTGIREAGRLSLDNGDAARLYIPGYDNYSVVEARTNRSRMFPAPSSELETLSILSHDPYYVLAYRQASPYFNVSIPGVCQLMDASVLAVNLALTTMQLSDIFNTVFNCSRSVAQIEPPTPIYQAYFAMPRTTTFLSKQPRIPKTIDFLPIFTAIFGEKIATVIMKEIK